MITRQLVTFELGDTLLGLDILLVKEINRRLDITPVFDVAYFVIGTANLRGQVITILDPGLRLDLLSRRTSSERGGVIVLKTEKELTRLHRSGGLSDHSVTDQVGLLVDRIGDVIEVEQSAIHAVPANLDPVVARYAGGVIPVEDDLVVVLRLEQLLAVESVAAR
jgi:purine-binding chemotaxis protein CheW